MPAISRLLLLVPTALLAIGFAACPGETPDDPIVEADGGTLTDPDSGMPLVLDAGFYGDPVTFKVMSWNVHDFFDDIDDPALENESYSNDYSGETVLTSTQVSSKLTKLATVIKTAKPDVLAMQEVETKDLLRRLNEKLGTASLPHYDLKDTYDSRGINVAIMSRFPITKIVSHAQLGERFYHPELPNYVIWPRDCLEVHLDLGGNRTVALLVNHHTSQRDNGSTIDSELKREAQSMEARRLADQLRTDNPLLPVLIVGDLNSDEGSSPVNILTAGGRYVDVGMKVSLSSRWTYEYRGEQQRLDYIIPDSETAKRVDQVYFVHSSAVDDASDHHPVTVTFTW
jgi:predicted extracellular nuclease